MRILLISDNEIFGRGGGSLEEHKYFDGIRNYIKEHGGCFKAISIDNKPFDEKLNIDIKKNKLIDVSSRLLLHSTYMYFAWIKNKRKILEFNPDIVFIGRSRMGFIAKEIKRINPKIKIVCNMENVELDYVDGYFADKKGFINRAYVLLEKIYVKRDEKNAVFYSDAIDYLSYRDKKRTHEIYGVIDKIETILPICLENSTTLSMRSEKYNVAFIGSLSYGSNVEAICDFIEHTWLPYFSQKNNMRLIVAGRNPSKEVKLAIDKVENCILYEDFTSLEDILPTNTLMIAPIKNGAGMKVKVAESLSMGLSIVASDEALVGYEAALENDFIGAIYRANNSNGYVEAIERYISSSMDTLEAVRKQNISIYANEFSYGKSRSVISEIINSVLRLPSK